MSNPTIPFMSRARQEAGRTIHRLITSSDDPELAFKIGDATVCQKCARGLLEEGRSSWEFAANTKVIDTNTDWECDCCDASYKIEAWLPMMRAKEWRNG